MATRITQDDLLEALTAAMRQYPADDAMTLNEISEKLGVGRERAVKVLAQFKKEGRLEVVQVWREAISGRMQQAPGYRVKPAPKKK